MELLGITQKRITINKYFENVSSLENTEVILVYGNIVNNGYQ